MTILPGMSLKLREYLSFVLPSGEYEHVYWTSVVVVSKIKPSAIVNLVLIRAHEIARIYAVKHEDRRTSKEDTEVPGKITSSLPDVRQFSWFMLPVFRFARFRAPNSRTCFRCDLDWVQVSPGRSHLLLLGSNRYGEWSIITELCVMETKGGACEADLP